MVIDDCSRYKSEQVVCEIAARVEESLRIRAQLIPALALELDPRQRRGYYVPKPAADPAADPAAEPAAEAAAEPAAQSTDPGVTVSSLDLNYGYPTVEAAKIAHATAEKAKEAQETVCEEVEDAWEDLNREIESYTRTHIEPLQRRIDGEESEIFNLLSDQRATKDHIKELRKFLATAEQEEADAREALRVADDRANQLADAGYASPTAAPEKMEEYKAACKDANSLGRKVVKALAQVDEFKALIKTSQNKLNGLRGQREAVDSIRTRMAIEMEALEAGLSGTRQAASQAMQEKRDAGHVLACLQNNVASIVRRAKNIGPQYILPPPTSTPSANFLWTPFPGPSPAAAAAPSPAAADPTPTPQQPTPAVSVLTPPSPAATTPGDFDIGVLMDSLDLQPASPAPPTRQLLKTPASPFFPKSRRPGLLASPSTPHYSTPPHPTPLLDFMPLPDAPTGQDTAQETAMDVVPAQDIAAPTAQDTAAPTAQDSSAVSTVPDAPTTAINPQLVESALDHVAAGIPKSSSMPAFLGMCWGQGLQEAAEDGKVGQGGEDPEDGPLHQS